MSCYLLHFNAAVYRFTLIEWLNVKPSQILCAGDCFALLNMNDRILEARHTSNVISMRMGDYHV